MDNDDQSFNPNTQPNQQPDQLNQPVKPVTAEDLINTSTPAPAPTPMPEPTPTPVPTFPESDPMPDIPVIPVKEKTPLNKRLIALIVVALALVVCAVVAVVVISNAANKKSNSSNSSNSSQVDNSIDEVYDLSELTADLTITKAGTFELTGELSEHSVIVNADGAVTLYLNNATISATQTAAIANISPNALTIELADKSINKLTDGGASDYDACIYSTGALTIDGDSGTLTVEGRQNEGEGIATETNDLTIDGGQINVYSADDGLNAGGDGGTITINGGEIFIQAGGDGIDSNKSLVVNGGSIYVIGSSTGGDAGIDTDSGYTINGGTLIALGSDMLEKPSDSSKQNSLAISLDKTYDVSSKIGIYSSSGDPVVEVTAGDAFRTIVFSSEGLSYGTYTLKINDETVIETLTVMNTVTTYGNVDQQPGGDNNPPENPSDNNQPENNNQSNNDQALNDSGDVYGQIPLSQIPIDE